MNIKEKLIALKESVLPKKEDVEVVLEEVAEDVILAVEEEVEEDVKVDEEVKEELTEEVKEEVKEELAEEIDEEIDEDPTLTVEDVMETVKSLTEEMALLMDRIDRIDLLEKGEEIVEEIVEEEMAEEEVVVDEKEEEIEKLKAELSEAKEPVSEPIINNVEVELSESASYAQKVFSNISKQRKQMGLD